MLLAEEVDAAGFAITLLIGIVLVVIAAVYGRGFRLGGWHGRRYRKLSDLARDVSQLTGLLCTADLDDATWFPKLENVSFRGKLASGRRATVGFRSVSAGSATITYVQLAVSGDEAPDLTISLENTFTRIGKFIGTTQEIEVGDKPFDDRYLLKTKDPVRARQALSRNAELRGAIDTLFEYGTTPEVKVSKGSYTFEVQVSSLHPDLYPSVLAVLDRVAAHFDRVKLKVKRLGGDRQALVDASGRTRCPYCRDAIRGDEDTLTACESCSTVLHEECWDQHGGCPIFGCAGQRPGRQRARGG